MGILGDISMNFASILSYASYPEVYVEGSEFCVIQRHGGIRNTGGGANVINGRGASD